MTPKYEKNITELTMDTLQMCANELHWKNMTWIMGKMLREVLLHCSDMQ